MIPAKIPDGSEGTGMLELVCQRTKRRETTTTSNISGCFLKNDENLQSFIKGHISPSADMNKLKNTKFFFYISDSKLLKQGIDSKATINYYRFSNSKKDKTCEPVKNPHIVKVDKHAFLLCDSKDLNKKCDFLGKYAKKVWAYQTYCMDDIESKEFFGLGKEESKLKFISLKMKKSESNTSNDFIVDSSTYEKLEDTGPILLDDKETVVGCFRKTTDNSKISISIFGDNQEETDKKLLKKRRKKKRENEGETSKVNRSASCSEDNSDSEETDNMPSKQEREKERENEESETSEVNRSASCSEDNSDSEDTDTMPSKQEREKERENEEETDNMPPKQEREKERENEGETSKVNGSASCSEERESMSIEENIKNPPEAGYQITTKGSGSCQYLTDHWQSKERIARVPREYENPPRHNVREPTQVSSKSEPPPVDQSAANPQQMCLKEFFERDSDNVITLGRFLDRQSMVIKNHEHLADRLEADRMIKLRCKSNTDHSPTYDLLQLPKVSVLTVNDLVKKLKDVKNNYIANMIEKIIPENPNLTIEEALKQKQEVFEKVSSELDKKGFYWRQLGGQFGIERDELNQIEMGCNPSKVLLEEYAYKLLEPEQLTIAHFRGLLETLERYDILELLKKFGITPPDDRSMKDVIPPDSEIMRRLCLLLNKNLNGSLKDWKNLAREWGIPYDIYSQFKPSTKESPTKILLDWLINERPDFTVNELCERLKEMKRNDAREFVEKKLKEYNAEVKSLTPADVGL